MDTLLLRGGPKRSHPSTYLPDTRPSGFFRTQSRLPEGTAVHSLEPTRRSDRPHSCCCRSSTQRAEKDSDSHKHAHAVIPTPHKEKGSWIPLSSGLLLGRCNFKFNLDTWVMFASPQRASHLRDSGRHFNLRAGSVSL